MNRIRKGIVRRIILILLISLFGIQGFAQISQGGNPIEFPRLKKLSDKVLVDLPYLNNDKLVKASLANSNDLKLKSLRFAESIPVCLNTSNSGEWVEYRGYNIWTLEIRSEGAKSLNLIFDEYDLPVGARLFIYSADKQDLIGAFTSDNNKASGILATEPVYGGHIVIQYEEPQNADFDGKLSVGEVNHDFIGILDLKAGRRPNGLSGECNVNINCDYLDDYGDVSNGIVRIVAGGTELCSGTLMNNSKNDGTPYIYTAGHCIKTGDDAGKSIFLFNYESPYCGEIDGDVKNSVSGSILKARSDSLDFCLVEMSSDPPPAYRPYYVGWDRSSSLPDSSVCIHHPQGDIKKIAIDRHSPKINSYGDEYIDNAFFLNGNWEEGTTEKGSSGAALFNQDGNFVGSLTGGAANCNSPVRDYFSRLHVAWDYFDDPAMRLKDWLDPDGSDRQAIGGLVPYEGKDFCRAFTNFSDDDVHENLEITEGEIKKGYWAGVNEYGYDTFAEKFEKDSSSDILGVSIGMALADFNSASSGSKFKLLVYTGASFPEKLMYEQEYNLVDIDPGVMNYFPFDERVTVENNFFIAFSIDQLHSEDTLSVYLAKREVNPTNSFYIKDGNEWYTYQDKTTGSVGSAVLMEVVLCNIDYNLKDIDIITEVPSLKAFPNPVSSGNSKLFLQFEEEVNPKRIGIYDFSGRLVYEDLNQSSPTKWLDLDFSGYKTGTYFVRVITDEKVYKSKVLYLGD